MDSNTTSVGESVSKTLIDLAQYPRNPILHCMESLVRVIDEEGHEYENTKELLCCRCNLLLRSEDFEVNLDKCEQEVKDYFGAERYARRMEDEMFHYQQLRFGLLHKVEENYFFQKSPLESRKHIVFSNDCISSVQYIKRKGHVYLMVHMRSSDVKGLFPLDALYLAKAFKEITSIYTSGNKHVPFDPDPVTHEEMIINIGSAHYYTSGGRA